MEPLYRLFRYIILVIFMIISTCLIAPFLSVAQAVSYSVGSLTTESFESGTLNDTIFQAESGGIATGVDKVINGTHSAYLSSNNHAFTHLISSKLSKFVFEKMTTYSVTFTYKSLKEPKQENNGYFYFLARSSDQTDDKGWTHWSAPAGTIETKTIEFTTGNFENYFLLWGIYDGGAISIDDISICKVSESFESGSYEGTNYLAGSGYITNDPSKVINGKYSAFLSYVQGSGFTEFTYTDAKKIKFEKNTKYSVTYTFKSIEAPPADNNGYFYFLVRSTAEIYNPDEDRAWTTWTASAGTQQMQTIEFRTGNEDNYYLIWGIHNGGALSLDNIIIKKIEESFEKGSYKDTSFMPVSGVITNDPTKVVDGQYSAYLSASAYSNYTEFTYTNPQKIKFKKNTTYRVTFKYKSVQESNGFFYFLARSTSAQYNPQNDIGWTTWSAPTGESHDKVIDFTTGSEDNYFLIWGIYGVGALSLDNIIIEEHRYQYDQQGRLVVQYLTSGQRIEYYYDNNGNLLTQKLN